MNLTNLRFDVIRTRDEYMQVMQFRQRAYEKKLQYMLHELSTRGDDVYDAYSYIFAVWNDDKMIATIRFTPYQFETLQFIKSDQLAAYLGRGWQTSYLEVSRLLLDQIIPIRGVVNALIMHAFMFILKNTHYTRFFGFSRPTVRPIFSRFQLDEETLRFNIPSRGAHDYFLLKGNFHKSYLNFNSIPQLFCKKV